MENVLAAWVLVLGLAWWFADDVTRIADALSRAYPAPSEHTAEEEEK